jgi:hypothetical protein
MTFELFILKKDMLNPEESLKEKYNYLFEKLFDTSYIHPLDTDVSLITYDCGIEIDVISPVTPHTYYTRLKRRMSIGKVVLKTEIIEIPPLKKQRSE